MMISDSQSIPLVSVVIPVYNSETYLSQTISSALAQTYPNFEVIAIDDGSVDGSVGVLRQFGDAIRIIRQNNAGSARARNVGIEAAAGEFVAFLDADDLWHMDKLELQVAHLMSHAEIGLVYNNWLVADERSNEQLATFTRQRYSAASDISLVEEQSGWLYSKLLLDSLVHTSAAMIRKSLFAEAGGFDESLRKGQDYDYWIRLSRHTQFHKLAPCLSVYRIHGDGITQQPSKVNFGAEILDRALNQWGRTGPEGSTVSIVAVRNRLSQIWKDFGELHLRSGNVHLARTSLAKSCKCAPWHIGRWKSLAKALLTVRNA